MLTRNLIESELSLAYLQAVAAKVGFAVDVPHIDTDTVDAVISAKGKLDPSSILHSPRIEVQLKASYNVTANGEGNLPFALDLRSYNGLRANTLVPRLLVLLQLPPNEAEWLRHEPEQVIMKRCAYFLSLKGLGESNNNQSQTVYIPVRNMLSPEALRTLMVKVSKEENL